MSPWLSDLLLRSQTDERLIGLAQLGHKRAFELIAERYRRPLTAYAHRLDPRRADDLVQQTFLSALAALQGGAEVRHLRGWLYEILRNHARREYASCAPLAELDEADSVTASAQVVAEQRMLAVDALGAVAQLPARQHDAIVQMAFQGMSRSEVAHSMGLSEGAVRQLVHRGRAAVRTAVTAITPMPILRWLYSPRSVSGTGLTEATLGAGTASGAGLALKVGVGAIVASGVVAGGVISATVSTHHRVTAQLAAHSRSAVSGRSEAVGGARVPATASALADRGSAAPRSPRPALSAGHGQAIPGGRFRFAQSSSGATVGSDGFGRDGGARSGSGGPGGGDGGSSSGRQNGGGGSDHSSGSGSSGPGSGDRGSSGSDGGGTGSGGGTSGSGGTNGGGGTDGGGSQPTAVTSGDGGGGSGGDGGLVSSGGGPGPSSSSDGGGLTGTSGSGSDGGSSSGGGSSSDGGSSSLDGSGSSSASGSGSVSSDGH